MHSALSTLLGKKCFIILRRLWQINYEKAGYEVSLIQSHFIFLTMKKKTYIFKEESTQNENDFGENLANIFIIYHGLHNEIDKVKMPCLPRSQYLNKRGFLDLTNQIQTHTWLYYKIPHILDQQLSYVVVLFRIPAGQG